MFKVVLNVRLWLALLMAAGVVAYLAYPTSRPVAAVIEVAASLEQGRYLARAGNCAACHTAEGGEPYAGGLAFKTPFGTLFSTNITPDTSTGIGGWDFADFYRAMKHGERPDGTHLYPAFPYTDFAKMTDTDIASLFVYLQSVSPVELPNRPNALAFPYSQRALLGFWKSAFHDSRSFEPDPTRSPEWNRGAYLVEGPGHCGACHTPRNLLGAERQPLALAGGVHQARVKRGGYRMWSAANLTSAPTGLGSWSEDELIAYLKTGVNDRAVVHGPMREVVMDSTRHLDDADLKAMAVYLKDLPPTQQFSGPAPSAQRMAEGEIVYTVHCGSCHLPTGLGDKGLGVSLAGNATVQAPDPSSLINVILYGPHLPAPPFAVDRSTMKMFGKRLSDKDIAGAATYVRASFGNQAGEVTPEQVKAQR